MKYQGNTLSIVMVQQEEHRNMDNGILASLRDPTTARVGIDNRLPRPEVATPKRLHRWVREDLQALESQPEAIRTKAIRASTANILRTAEASWDWPEETSPEIVDAVAALAIAYAHQPLPEGTDFRWYVDQLSRPTEMVEERLAYTTGLTVVGAGAR